jgi:hypothetical protein
MEARVARGAERDAAISAAQGDKVPGFDPAASPVKTDAEAAGTPTRPMQHPASDPAPDGPAPDGTDRAADPAGASRQRYRVQDRMIWPTVIALAVVGVGAALLIFVLFAG